jgi:histone demethylase JARID1
MCKSAYDAWRPMISCDQCEGWFHYECCGMCPPGEDESEVRRCRLTLSNPR